VTADGKPVPSQVVVRSRWGHTDETSIRWLGVDIQSGAAPAWWPDRKAVPYYLEFGPDVKPAVPEARVALKETEAGVEVDTGPLKFVLRRGKFNMIDRAWLNGKETVASAATSGAYLIDHEGAVYRAANDAGSTLTVEEKGDLRVVLRAEGWYVKDGATGDSANYSLPTDRLCKFVTRVEAYAGLPYVRLLQTWILTFDPNTVRLRDVGVSLPAAGARRVSFGVEGNDPVAAEVGAKGAYLIQHLPDRFDVEDGVGKALGQGKRSAGWALVETDAGLMSLGHRETWQRFPKEFEVLPGEARLHIWPAHGRAHPEIDPLAHEQINRLWFAHQGKEMNLAQPWNYYFAVSQIIGDPSEGVYKGGGLALAGVHSSSLGAALTSDIMAGFAAKGQDAAAREQAEVFQAAPHAVADPRWFCDSLAAGWLHPYDPERMKYPEEIIENMMRGQWETQDACGEYGMWLYRVWHHNHLTGPGKWQLYRLYNATHHYEAFLPWMLYARSGDPFYLTQGSANIRILTDVQVIHYDDPKYPHKEFHFAQKRLVGSTRHTNGFNTWGGDHAVLAHLTCYNGMMLAYYLTGDLRLREVVVDEWQKTLLTEQANPEFAKADRSKGREFDGARDVTNALGEMIDLYQLTYHPAVLAHMAPMMDFFLNKFMRHWGQPLHNTLLFYGSEQARRQLLEGVAEYRAKNGKPDDPKRLWATHSDHENFALASIVDPRSGAHADAWLASDVAFMRSKARDVRAQKPLAAAFCGIPDYLIYLPRMMRAVVSAGTPVSLSSLAASQPMPACDAKNAGWMRCIVRKDKDEAFDINVFGQVQQGGAPVKVFGPDMKLIVESKAPEGAQGPWTLNVPKDGRTGEYVIFIKAADAKAKLLVPLTTLPEVYHVGYWAQHSPSQFFVRSRGGEPELFEFKPHAGAGMALLDDGSELARTDKGEPMKFEAGPKGVWLLFKVRYVHPAENVTLSIGPDRWFAPSEAAMALKP